MRIVPLAKSALTGRVRRCHGSKPVWRAVCHASRVHVPGRACGCVWGIRPRRDQAHAQGNECLDWPNGPGPNLRKSWLAFAAHRGFWVCRHVICNYLPSLAFTGVARKAWILPVSGPVRTVAMPEICPRSLILFAMVARRWRLVSLGNSELRSVITPS